MLAYILAVVVGTGSVGLYLAAFFLPAVHRKPDFIWSGVGLFYALFLWLYARQVTGGILVGQTTSVLLLGWLTWQLFNLRRQAEPLSQQVTIPSSANKSTTATKSTATVAVAPATTPPATARVPAKATAPPQTPKATSNPVATAAKSTQPATTPSSEGATRRAGSQLPPNPAVAPPAPPPASNLDPAKATSVARKTAPTAVSSQPVSTTPISTPPASNLDPAEATPVARKTAPAPVDRAAPPENRTPPAKTDPVPAPQPILAAAEEERAWITLETKPSVPAPPLGTPAQPPAAKIPPTEPKTVTEVTPIDK